MILLEDQGQKLGQHTVKNNYWKGSGIEVTRCPLPVGDYVIANEQVVDVINRKAKRGVALKKMDFLGTYKVAVDTKKDMAELYADMFADHERFRDECILAQNNGIKLYVLVENEDGIKTIDDVFKWNNPRLKRYNTIAYMHRQGKWQNVALPKRPPVPSPQMAKAMLSMQTKYGVEFVFTPPNRAGSKVIELLTKE